MVAVDLWGAVLGLLALSPPETISLREAVLMLIGTACSAIAALAVMAAAAAALARPWQGIAPRVAGSWVAAIAILVLALRWAG
jgi:urease accessory protein